MLYLAASGAAGLTALLLISFEATVASTVCCVGVAMVWLMLAWRRRWPWLYAASEGATVLAVLLGTATWLNYHAAEFDPTRILQTYGLALTGLSLLWASARFLCRKQPLALALAEPGWRGVDWLLSATLMVGSLIVVGIYLVPEVMAEVGMAVRHRGAGNLFAVPPLDLGRCWTALGLMAASLILRLWGSRPRDVVLGCFLWLLTAAGVVAYTWSEALAAGSMARWALTIAFLLGSCLLWLRTTLRRQGERLGIVWTGTWNVSRASRIVLILGSVLPVLFITGMVAAVGFRGGHPPGPHADTVFAWMGWTVNVVVPLLILAITLTGHGARENEPGYIFAANLVLLATVTGGYALGVVTGGGVLDDSHVIFLLQLAAMIIPLGTMAWLASGRWRHRPLQVLHLSLAVTAQVALLMPAFVGLLTHEAGPWPPLVIQTATWAGWASLLLCVAAAFWLTAVWQPSGSIHVFAIAGLAVGITIACAVASASADPWASYHVLCLTWTTLAFMILAGQWLDLANNGAGSRVGSRLAELFRVDAAQRWINTIGAFVVLLAFGGAANDPGRPYWAGAFTLTVAILAGASAIRSRQVGYVFASGLLLNLVACLAWQAWQPERPWLMIWLDAKPDAAIDFVLLQILALAGGSLAWSLIGGHLPKRQVAIELTLDHQPYSRTALFLAVGTLMVLGIAAIASDVLHLGLQVHGPLVWWVVALTGLAQLRDLWTTRTQPGRPLAMCYLLGLAIGSLVLHQAALAPRDLGWYTALWLAGHVFLASVCAYQLRLPGQLEEAAEPWFLPLQAFVGLAVVGLSFWICLDFAALSERLAGAWRLACSPPPLCY